MFVLKLHIGPYQSANQKREDLKIKQEVLDIPAAITVVFP